MQSHLGLKAPSILLAMYTDISVNTRQWQVVLHFAVCPPLQNSLIDDN